MGRKAFWRIHERLDITPRQLRLIQKISSHNECRIVVRDLEHQEYLLLRIARSAKSGQNINAPQAKAVLL
jgi:hypothetical protein